MLIYIFRGFHGCQQCDHALLFKAGLVARSKIEDEKIRVFLYTDYFIAAHKKFPLDYISAYDKMSHDITLDIMDSIQSEQYEVIIAAGIFQNKKYLKKIFSLQKKNCSNISIQVIESCTLRRQHDKYWQNIRLLWPKQLSQYVFHTYTNMTHQMYKIINS